MRGRGYPQAMSELRVELAANRDLLVGIGPLVIGIVVVVLLIAAVVYGRRRQAREPEPPQQPQPRSGAWETPDEARAGTAGVDHGPGHQETSRTTAAEHREPSSMPQDGVRRTPHHLTDSGGPGTGEGDPVTGDHRGGPHGTP